MSSLEHPWTAFAFFISFLLLVRLRSLADWRARSRGRPLPPGPPRLPLVGNLFNLPSGWKPWVGYRNLIQQYGDMVYVEVLGRPMLLLGNPSVMLEFLDKRASITSDRVKSPLLQLAGQGFNFAFMPYGQWWRRHRRAFWQQFHPAVVSRYWPSQQSSTRELLVKLLDKPAACDDLLRYHFSASALKAVYNVDITGVDDKRVAVIEDLFVGLREITVSAQFFLDYFPVLQYVPTCTPGIGKWLKKLAASKAPNDYLIDKEFADAKARVERNGAADVSAVSHLLAKISETSAEEEAIDGEDEQIAKGVAAVAVEGGTDTTFSTAEGFFLAMALHPEVQRKAQAELDAVVGPHRLPDFSDRESLVYINALVKESLRWHNVLPLGVPHRTIQDDEFHGYFIPKGTLVTPNVWACMHDPQIYPEPKKFNPDRFVREGKLTPDVLDPTNFVFGFGRRICPGRHFADAGLFILIASVLHVYNIEPPLGEDGRPIKIDHEQCHGFLSYPENFACVVKPRSEKAVALIRRSRPAKGLESD